MIPSYVIIWTGGSPSGDESDDNNYFVAVLKQEDPLPAVYLLIGNPVHGKTAARAIQLLNSGREEEAHALLGIPAGA